MSKNISLGFTLIETLSVVAILAVLAALVIHLTSSQIQKQRLTSAAQTVFQSLQNARSETFKQNQPIYVSFKQSNADNEADNSWCYGLALSAECDCTGQDLTRPCELKSAGRSINTSILHTQFPGVRLTKAAFGSKPYTRFNPIRGTAAFGSVTLVNSNDESLQIRLSLLGRTRICNPDNTPFSKYVPC